MKASFQFDRGHLKNYFLTGIILLLPIALTAMIVSFLFNLLTSPFEGLMVQFLSSFSLFQKGFWIFSPTEIIVLASKCLILLSILGITLLLGALARWFFINWLIKIGEGIVNRIPLIGSIYKTSQEVIRTIFTSQTKSFKQVVLAPYPSKETYALGLVTRDKMLEEEIAFVGDRVTVFIPTTPNPTSGFLLIYKREDLIYIDMPIEDALKFIISCGVISSTIQPMEPPKST